MCNSVGDRPIWVTHRDGQTINRSPIHAMYEGSTTYNLSHHNPKEAPSIKMTEASPHPKADKWFSIACSLLDKTKLKIQQLFIIK